MGKVASGRASGIKPLHIIENEIYTLDWFGPILAMTASGVVGQQGADGNCAGGK